MGVHNSRGRRIDNILKDLGLAPTDVPLEQVKAMHPTMQKLDRCTSTGKVCFPSKAMAEGRISRLLNKGMANTSALRSYLCPDCHGFHISSSFKL